MGDKKSSDYVATTTFRAFSAGNLQLLRPGPMAQAITFRAFGAEQLLTFAFSTYLAVENQQVRRRHQ